MPSYGQKLGLRRVPQAGCPGSVPGREWQTLGGAKRQCRGQRRVPLSSSIGIAAGAGPAQLGQPAVSRRTVSPSQKTPPLRGVVSVWFEIALQQAAPGLRSQLERLPVREPTDQPTGLGEGPHAQHARAGIGPTSERSFAGTRSGQRQAKGDGQGREAPNHAVHESSRFQGKRQSRAQQLSTSRCSPAGPKRRSGPRPREVDSQLSKPERRRSRKVV